MSWQACDWMDGLDYDVCGPLATRVLLKLANAAAPDGTRAFRSKAEMAKELGVSQRSIQRALKELEYAALIHPGDQEFVHHIRADRRPIVYDLNFRYQTQYESPELPVWNGETQLSTTPPRGDTPGLNGETTVVAQGTVFNDIKNSSRGNHRPRAVQEVEYCPAGHELIEGRCALACTADLERREALAGASS